MWCPAEEKVPILKITYFFKILLMHIAPTYSYTPYRAKKLTSNQSNLIL